MRVVKRNVTITSVSFARSNKIKYNVNALLISFIIRRGEFSAVKKLYKQKQKQKKTTNGGRESTALL